MAKKCSELKLHSSLLNNARTRMVSLLSALNRWYYANAPQPPGRRIHFIEDDSFPAFFSVLFFCCAVFLSSTLRHLVVTITKLHTRSNALSNGAFPLEWLRLCIAMTTFNDKVIIFLFIYWLSLFRVRTCEFTGMGIVVLVDNGRLPSVSTLAFACF